MRTLRTGEHPTLWLSLAGLLCVCVALGVLAGHSPAYAIGLGLAIIFVGVSLSDPRIGLLVFTSFSFLEVLNTGGSLTKVLGLLLFASWAARALTTSSAAGARTLLSETPAVVWGSLALITWSAVSVAWAGDVPSAYTDTYRYALNALLIPIVFGTVRSGREVRWLTMAFVAGAVISSIYGFAHPPSATGFQAGQLSGGIGDANEQAAVLVGAIAFAFGLALTRTGGPAGRWAVAIAILICLAGVVNSLSRSGLIALVAMLVAAVVVGGRWRRWAALLLVVSTVVGVGYFFTITSPQARTRVTSADTSGRSTIWTVGWRMFRHNSVLGVGAGNFQHASIHYLQAPTVLTRTDLIVKTPKVAHNIYLEVLADLGVPGLLAFLTVVLGSLAAAWRAAARFAALGDLELELMARCTVLALVGFMTSDIFLSGEFSKQLWLVIAVGPTLLGIARRSPAARSSSGVVTPRRTVPSPTIVPA